MDWLFIAFALIGAFVMLSLMGYERQRRVNEHVAAQPPEPPPGQPVA